MKYFSYSVFALSAALVTASSATAQTPPYTINGVLAESLNNINDLNADGFRELVVGQPSSDRVDFYSGKAAVVLRTYSGTAGSRFGASLAPYRAWSLPNQPLDALVVGAPNPSSTAPNGEFRIVYSGTSGSLLYKHGPFTPTPPQCLPPQYGSSVAVIGDLNGDGHPEVAVGAPDWDYGGCTGTGLVEIVDVWGAGGGTLLKAITPPAGFSYTGGGSCFTSQIHGMAFGFALAAVGDLDGDGFADLVVSAPGANTVFVYSGASLRPGFTPIMTGYSTFAGYAHGYSLTPIGDLDSDGIGDFVIGSPQFNGANGTANAFSGSTAIHAGGGSFLGMHVFSFAVNNQTFGTTVSKTRDIDGDGVADYVVGAGSACNGVSSSYYAISGATNGQIAHTSSTNPQFANVVCATGNVGSVVGIPSIMVSDLTAQKVFIKNP